MSGDVAQHSTDDTAEAWSSRQLAGNPHDVADKAGRVQRMFASIARSYDLNNRLHSFGRDQSWRRHLARLCEIRPDDAVLDVACGTGDLALAFAPHRPRRIVGVDFTPAMLDIARHKAKPLPRPICRPTFEHGDATSLRFAEGEFDVVSIAFGIRNVSDPAKALAEFHRVLKPGGRLAILEFSEPGNRFLRVLNRLYTRRIMPLTASLIARDRSGAYRYLPRSIETFLDRDAVGAAVEGAGFDPPSQTPLTFGVCVAYVARKPASGV